MELAGWVCGAPAWEVTRDIASEWVAVHPVHPEGWPAGARACAEVWYFLPAELRAEEQAWPAGEPLEAAEFRMERMELLSRELELAGYRVGFVDRGWLGPNLLAVA
ncbi:hypothetical protein [Streptomyces sp. NPDC017260]|uniref:hypothetical protein n=1 Tax=unclassified Streptomyces TaxID=2593676 RepID=UPI00379C2991